MLIWGSLTQRWAGLSLAPGCPRALTPSLSRAAPALELLGRAMAFQGRAAGGTDSITGASQKQLRAFSDLLPFT